MSYEPNVHQAQMAVLRALLFVPSASFVDLQKATKLESDHFVFHLKKLTKEGYVEKLDGGYKLSVKGKEYANRLDTDENVIEKQPKVVVVVGVERVNADGVKEYLFQQRRKNPYFGFWGRITGKMRWGESILEAAQRELHEETGLSARFEYKMLYHKRDFSKETGELLEDKIFLCVEAYDVTGSLTEEFEGGYNKWMTMESFLKEPKRFKSVDEFTSLINEGVPFKEGKFYYESKEY